VPWTYDPTASTFDRWPSFGNGPPSWGSVPTCLQYYTVDAPLVGQASLLALRNHTMTGFPPAYGAVTKMTGVLHFWGETEDDYIAMPGLTQGRVRSLFQIREASGTGRHQLGAVCLASRDDTEEAGTAYGLMLDGSQSGTTWETLQLVYYPGPDGLRTPYTILAQQACVRFLSDLLALELRWHYTAESDTLILLGFLGSAPDYSDLALHLRVDQHPTPVASIVTQGVAVVTDLASPTVGHLTLVVDDTTMEGTV
jgi:hypothetical protein